MSKSSNIKTKISNFYETAKESNKTARIISFFAGFIFNILGIIAVAVWKLIFSKSEEKNKYCIRLSILGLITKIIIFSKFLSFLFLSNIFDDKGFNHHFKHKPVVHSIAFGDFDREFARMHRRMNRVFEEQQKVFDEMFNDAVEEQVAFENEIKKIEKEDPKDVKVNKEVKNENGFETTTIEKTSPNSYQQHTTIKYVGDNTKNSKKDDKNKNNIKKQDKRKTKNKDKKYR